MLKFKNFGNSSHWDLYVNLYIKIKSRELKNDASNMGPPVGFNEKMEAIEQVLERGSDVEILALAAYLNSPLV